MVGPFLISRFVRKTHKMMDQKNANEQIQKNLKQSMSGKQSHTWKETVPCVHQFHHATNVDQCDQ